MRTPRLLFSLLCALSPLACAEDEPDQPDPYLPIGERLSSGGAIGGSTSAPPPAPAPDPGGGGGGGGTTSSPPSQPSSRPF